VISEYVDKALTWNEFPVKGVKRWKNFIEPIIYIDNRPLDFLALLGIETS